MSAAAQQETKQMDDGLEWIKLRRELDDIRVREYAKSRPSYKYNWYLPIGVSITGALYFYGLYHMNDINRSARAAYCRVTSQFLCASIFAYGFLKHHNREIKLHKDEKKRRKLMQNAMAVKSD